MRSTRIKVAVEVDKTKEAPKFSCITWWLKIKDSINFFWVGIQTTWSNNVSKPFNFFDPKKTFERVAGKNFFFEPR